MSNAVNARPQGTSSTGWTDEGSIAPLTNDEFVRISERVRQMAGIVLEDHKKQMIFSRMSRYLRDKGYDSVSDYLNHLDKMAGPDELQEFVNVLTTNLTSFFREKHHFDHLQKELLEPMKSAGANRIRIWSAGCSSGEEPYTIALSIQAVFGRIPQDMRILATDLDTKVLATGRAGSYPSKKLSGIPPNYARALPRPDEEDIVKMPSELKAAISFKQLNLLENWPMKGKFEAIFCRNVMIYFDAETKARLIDRFADALVPGGTLYIGHSESILGQHAKLESLGDTIYRRGPAA